MLHAVGRAGGRDLWQRGKKYKEKHKYINTFWQPQLQEIHEIHKIQNRTLHIALRTNLTYELSSSQVGVPTHSIQLCWCLKSKMFESALRPVSNGWTVGADSTLLLYCIQLSCWTLVLALYRVLSCIASFSNCWSGLRSIKCCERALS